MNRRECGPPTHSGQLSPRTHRRKSGLRAQCAHYGQLSRTHQGKSGLRAQQLTSNELGSEALAKNSRKTREPPQGASAQAHINCNYLRSARMIATNPATAAMATTTGASLFSTDWPA